jgi:transcriptional regulator with XRE-family HTH domain
MNQREDIRDFLTSRRASITPEQVALPPYHGRRRVPGLRREEVAQLAGISVDYYTRLERGNLTTVSDTVLDAVARVLRLDDAERTHLFSLAKTTGRPRRNRLARTVTLSPHIQWMLDAIVTAPAWVQNERLDLLAVNHVSRVLNFGLTDESPKPVNLARYMFLNPRSHHYFPDWDHHADDAVAILRTAAGKDPDEPQLTQLIGELSTRSEEFRVRWASHSVRQHRSGHKRINPPGVGLLELTYEGMELAAHPGLTLFIMTVEPGTPANKTLTQLAMKAVLKDYDHTTD